MKLLSTLRPGPFGQVLCAITLGGLLGWRAPALALLLAPAGDAFVLVIRWLVAPLLFFTTAAGFSTLGSNGLTGRVGLISLLYFESASALALVVGLTVTHLLQPGVGFRIGGADAGAGATHAWTAAPLPSLWHTIVAALSGNALLQLVLLGIFTGVVISIAGMRGRRVAVLCERVAGRLLYVLAYVLRAAPLAAFAMVAYAVGYYGIGSVGSLLRLVVVLYLASGIFVLLVLGSIARLAGFRLLRLIGLLKEELLLVVATSSSVAAMPGLIDKLQTVGCAPAMVAAVVPAGYFFNLNGTNIYLGAAIVFLAQAMHVPLDWSQYVTILAVTMITSKGAAGVAGSAFVVLSATVAVLPAIPAIPVEALALVLSIERLLKCRSLTNIVGNAVACVALSAWTSRLDRNHLARSGLATAAS